jgi:hypothetical protein
MVGIQRAAGAAAVRLAEKAIPVVGWGIAAYQGVHALGVAADEYQESFEQCVANPNN